MKYDVIKSTDQLMGIWGLGKVEKKDSDTKMILHTKLNDYRREVSHGNLKIPQADLADMLTELWCWRNGGVTEELLRASDGGIRIGKGCRIVLDESCDAINGDPLKALKLASQQPDVPEADFFDIPIATAH